MTPWSHLTGDREERVSRNACGRAAAYPQADLERCGVEVISVSASTSRGSTPGPPGARFRLC